MTWRRLLSFSGMALFCVLAAHADEAKKGTAVLEWELLPAVPDPLGFAGAYAGVSNGALLLAGGANFPEASPWENGRKVWYDSIFVLTSSGGPWQRAGTLPRPLAYGVSATTDRGVVCVGGGDAERHYADTFLLVWSGSEAVCHDLPPMPKPAAFFCGALLGKTIYVAGGEPEPKSSDALRTFFALDLDHLERGWQTREPWPGPGRKLAVAGVQDGAFFLISGRDTLPGTEAAPVMRFLNDAYRYTPSAGWSRIADIPNAAAAAPSPAIALGDSHLLVCSGDDGRYVTQDLRDKHPGFPPHIQAYHTITNTWTQMGEMPRDPGAGLWPHVTAPTTEWEGRIVIPNGEIRPGVRTPKVIAARQLTRTPRFSLPDYAVLAAYLGALVIMGLYFAGRERGTEDFFLAGHRIPWWAAGLSIFGTQLSAITFMAIPGKTFAANWTYFLGNMSIVAVAPLVVFLYLPFYRRLNITTAYEYLEKRFHLGARLFGSAAFVLFQLGRMGIVLFLPAIALEAVTGMDRRTCILLMGLLATLYTVMGGIEAVIWTDVLQVVVLLGGALVALVIIVADVGSIGATVEIAHADAKLETFLFSWDYTIPAIWVVFFGNLLANLFPYTADQAVVQRYLTTSDERQAARAVWTNAVLTIPATLLFFSIGTALYVFYKSHPDQLNPALKTDAIFPWFVASKLPAGIAGLVIAGVFAAAMSSLDSGMHSAATAITTDFFKRLLPGKPRYSGLRMARGLVVLLGIAATGTALLMASSEIKSLWDAFVKIMGLFGGSLAGIFALGMFTRRASGNGALAGAVASALVLYLVQRYTAVHFFLYGAIGIVTCFCVGYLASLLTPQAGRPLDGLTLYTIARGKDPRAGQAE